LGFTLRWQHSPATLQSPVPEVCFNGEEPQQHSMKNFRWRVLRK
jgi:hypothetical protein